MRYLLDVCNLNDVLKTKLIMAVIGIFLKANSINVRRRDFSSSVYRKLLYGLSYTLASKNFFVYFLFLTKDQAS